MTTDTDIDPALAADVIDCGEPDCNHLNPMCKLMPVYIKAAYNSFQNAIKGDPNYASSRAEHDRRDEQVADTNSL